jgi:hypothetical protein
MEAILLALAATGAAAAIGGGPLGLVAGITVYLIFGPLLHKRNKK